MERHIVITFIVLILACVYGLYNNWKQNHRTMEEIEKEKAEMEARRKKRTIVKAEIIGKHTKDRTGVGGAIIGGLIAGESGAMLGALAANKKPKITTTFRLYYEDGHTKTVTVEDGMGEWRDYIKYVPER